MDEYHFKRMADWFQYDGDPKYWRLDRRPWFLK